MSRYRLGTGMLFGSECSSCEVASPSRQSAQTLAAKGPGAQPDQFYANERSLGEDLPRGGGSGVTCQFRGKNGHFTFFHSSALCLPFAVEGKVHLSEESEWGKLETRSASVGTARKIRAET